MRLGVGGGGGAKVTQDAQCGSFLRVGGAAVQTVSSVVSCKVAEGNRCFRLVGWTQLKVLEEEVGLTFRTD